MPSSPRPHSKLQEPGNHDDRIVAGSEGYLQRLADALFRAAQRANFCRTDRFFAWLLMSQVVAAFLVALFMGQSRFPINPSTSAVLFLGALIVNLPVILAFVRPGEQATRHCIAAAQMVTSAVLIHLTHGRAETHFHVLVSFAFLAFYRDWRVLATATAVTLFDVLILGLLAPASVYGTEAVSQWRSFEHAGWVLLCNSFLARSCTQSVAEMKANAERHARLIITNARLRDAAEKNQETAGTVVAQHREILADRLDSQGRFESALYRVRSGLEL
jgi:methyl-accepting chemotaxis protein